VHERLSLCDSASYASMHRALSALTHHAYERVEHEFRQRRDALWDELRGSADGWYETFLMRLVPSRAARDAALERILLQHSVMVRAL
jgi:hypothetical protein